MNAKIMGIISLITVISGTVFGSFQTAFTAGRKAVSQKQYDLAINNYTNAAKQTKIPGQRFQAFYATAEVYRMKGDWKNAEKMLTQIINDKTIPVQNRMLAQVSMGDYKLKQKKIAEAILEYQKVQVYGIQNNESHYAMLSCANLSVQLKKYDDAAKYYQVLLNDPKVNATRKNRAKIGMGNVLYTQGKYQEAITMLKGIANDPKVPAGVRADALIIIARAQYKLKAYKDAYDTNMSIIALNNIPVYFKAAAYMQAISIQEGMLNNCQQAKKLLDDFEKMPGVNTSQKKWIKNYRAKIYKAEHTL